MLKERNPVSRILMVPRHCRCCRSCTVCLGVEKRVANAQPLSPVRFHSLIFLNARSLGWLWFGFRCI